MTYNPNPPDNNFPEFWTRERKIDHTNKMYGHELCKAGKWEEAQAFSKEWKIPYPPFPSSPTNQEQLDKYNAKKGRAKTNMENGLTAGFPKGGEQPTKITLATPADQEKLIDQVASALLQGKGGIRLDPRLGQLSDGDKSSLQRMMHMPAEEFNRRLADKLGNLADLITEKMLEKLKDDKFKPGELAFPLAVALDKRANLEGRNLLAGANIAVQVNNYGGSKSREQLMRSLKGLPEDDGGAIPVQATPPKPDA